MAAASCTRPGCGKKFDPDDSNTGECRFHPGGPTFHEGAKSWSCCRDLPGHRPVVSFEEFLKIPGCASGSHSLDEADSLPAIAPSPNAQPPSASPPSASVNGSLATSMGETSISTLPPPPAGALLERKRSPAPPKEDEQDEETATVPEGAKCKRLTCGEGWKGGAGERRGEGEGDECTYHPGTPIFHEGSKGYSCCKKRVLDFDDFLQLKGCKRGRHLFVGAPKTATNGDAVEEELVQCRMDHYQTPTQVIVSVFGKNADKSASTVTFDTQSLTVSLVLPGNKRFHRTFALLGPIDPSSSTYRLIAPKCEITLAKADARSWPALEIDDAAGAGHVTFGVQGRTGTVGAKQAVYDEGNRR